MSALTFTEENYLKAIYTLQSRQEKEVVSVNEIAEQMQTRPATVTDMMRKLSEKELVDYEKYKKLKLSEKGLDIALQIVRKHRLWETFLHDKLHFSWDEVHEVAEQLEHIHSSKLIDKLNEFLGYPKFDPHGDPIPDAKGDLPESSTLTLAEATIHKRYKIVAVKDTSIPFLQQLEKMNLSIGSNISIMERMPFDKSNLIKTTEAATVMLSEKIALNILVKSI